MLNSNRRLLKAGSLNLRTTRFVAAESRKLTHLNSKLHWAKIQGLPCGVPNPGIWNFWLQHMVGSRSEAAKDTPSQVSG